jgi:hypothetical protein
MSSKDRIRSDFDVSIAQVEEISGRVLCRLLLLQATTSGLEIGYSPKVVEFVGKSHDLVLDN